MPALSNPRWERFALALYAGLAGETRLDRLALCALAARVLKQGLNLLGIETTERM